MAIKIPLLIPGITVPTGGADIAFTSNTVTNATAVTLTAGTYWMDPLLGPAVTSVIVASDSTDPLGRLASLIDTADSGATYTAAYADDAGTYPSWDGDQCHFCQLTRSSGNVQLLPTNALTDTDGKRVLDAMGFSPLNDSANTTTLYGTGVCCFWAAPATRVETGDVDELIDGFGGVVRGYDGSAYGFSFGKPLRRRLVSLDAQPGAVIRSRLPRHAYATNTATALSADMSMEGVVWPRVFLGEPMRYYADANATTTYINAALNTTSTSVSVASATGLAQDDHVWLDGEPMHIKSISGTTLTVARSTQYAAAHSKYAPLSKDFVATYYVDSDGGNCNATQFAPDRRAVNQDRWDVSIPLIRAAGI